MTHDELKIQLSYDLDTGFFTWITSCRGIAGASKDGYIVIRVNKILYRAHRLAWFYIHGEWPIKFIDHINGNRSDNRICNLRQASHSENLRNTGMKPSNTSGFKGVTYVSSRGKFLAQISINYKTKFLGYFNTAEEASFVYEEFAKANNGNFYRNDVDRKAA